MAYHLKHTQLRALRTQIINADPALLSNTRLLILEHLLPTTEGVITLLREAGAEIFQIFAKPYSIDQAVLKRLLNSGLSVIQEPYSEYEKPGYLDSFLEQALIKSKDDGKKTAILEVGGYFANPLVRLSESLVPYLVGIVEDTTFGHNRYAKVIDKIRVPVFSVARSQLKEIEARFVGKDAVAAVEGLLRHRGISISGRVALVIGYGMIGSNVARALAAHDLKVTVYDIQDHRNLRAFIDGFHIHKKRELLKKADIIFSATGQAATSYQEIKEMKNPVILASVGSKDSEFDIKPLRNHATEKEDLGEHLRRYKLSNGNEVVVVRDGTAVNFILESTPAEVMDLVFAEMIICLLLLLEKPAHYAPGVIHQAPAEKVDDIAREWLKDVNV